MKWYIVVKKGVNMKNLKLLRFMKEVSLNEMSEVIGIPATNIWRYETGKVIPSFNDYKKIMDYFGYDVKTIKRGK